MIFDDDELFGDVLHNANMMRWYIYLDVDNYGDVGFMPILMSDDDVLVMLFLLSSHIHCIGDEGFYAKRRWALCQVFLIMDKATGTTCIT